MHTASTSSDRSAALSEQQVSLSSSAAVVAAAGCGFEPTPSSSLSQASYQAAPDGSLTTSFGSDPGTSSSQRKHHPASSLSPRAVSSTSSTSSSASASPYSLASSSAMGAGALLLAGPPPRKSTSPSSSTSAVLRLYPAFTFSSGARVGCVAAVHDKGAATIAVGGDASASNGPPAEFANPVQSSAGSISMSSSTNTSTNGIGTARASTRHAPAPGVVDGAWLTSSSSSSPHPPRAKLSSSTSTIVVSSQTMTTVAGTVAPAASAFSAPPCKPAATLSRYSQLVQEKMRKALEHTAAASPSTSTAFDPNETAIASSSSSSAQPSPGCTPAASFPAYHSPLAPASGPFARPDPKTAKQQCFASDEAATVAHLQNMEGMRMQQRINHYAVPDPSSQHQGSTSSFFAGPPFNEDRPLGDQESWNEQQQPLYDDPQFRQHQLQHQHTTPTFLPGGEADRPIQVVWSWGVPQRQSPREASLHPQSPPLSQASTSSPPSTSATPPTEDINPTWEVRPPSSVLSEPYPFHEQDPASDRLAASSEILAPGRDTGAWAAQQLPASSSSSTTGVWPAEAPAVSMQTFQEEEQQPPVMHLEQQKQQHQQQIYVPPPQHHQQSQTQPDQSHRQQLLMAKFTAARGDNSQQFTQALSTQIPTHSPPPDIYGMPQHQRQPQPPQPAATMTDGIYQPALETSAWKPYPVAGLPIPSHRTDAVTTYLHSFTVPATYEDALDTSVYEDEQQRLQREAQAAGTEEEQHQLQYEQQQKQLQHQQELQKQRQQQQDQQQFEQLEFQRREQLNQQQPRQLQVEKDRQRFEQQQVVQQMPPPAAEVATFSTDDYGSPSFSPDYHYWANGVQYVVSTESPASFLPSPPQLAEATNGWTQQTNVAAGTSVPAPSATIFTYIAGPASTSCIQGGQPQDLPSDQWSYPAAGPFVWRPAHPDLAHAQQQPGPVGAHDTLPPSGMTQLFPTRPPVTSAASRASSSSSYDGAPPSYTHAGNIPTPTSSVPSGSGVSHRPGSSESTQCDSPLPLLASAPQSVQYSSQQAPRFQSLPASASVNQQQPSVLTPDFLKGGTNRGWSAPWQGVQGWGTGAKTVWDTETHPTLGQLEDSRNAPYEAGRVGVRPLPEHVVEGHELSSAKRRKLELDQREFEVLTPDAASASDKGKAVELPPGWDTVYGQPYSEQQPPHASTSSVDSDPDTASVGNHDHSSIPVRKLLLACHFCRGRKLKCDGQQQCGNCSKRSYVCTYDEEIRRRGPGRKKKGPVALEGLKVAMEFATGIRKKARETPAQRIRREILENWEKGEPERRRLAEEKGTAEAAAAANGGASGLGSQAA